eukprot:7390422-Prymnesium_polylepis.2
MKNTSSSTTSNARLRPSGGGSSRGVLDEATMASRASFAVIDSHNEAVGMPRESSREIRSCTASRPESSCRRRFHTPLASVRRVVTPGPSPPPPWPPKISPPKSPRNPATVNGDIADVDGPQLAPTTLRVSVTLHWSSLSAPSAAPNALHKWPPRGTLMDRCQSTFETLLPSAAGSRSILDAVEEGQCEQSVRLHREQVACTQARQGAVVPLAIVQLNQLREQPDLRRRFCTGIAVCGRECQASQLGEERRARPTVDVAGKLQRDQEILPEPARVEAIRPRMEGAAVDLDVQHVACGTFRRARKLSVHHLDAELPPIGARRQRRLVRRCLVLLVFFLHIAVVHLLANHSECPHAREAHLDAAQRVHLTLWHQIYPRRTQVSVLLLQLFQVDNG